MHLSELRLYFTSSRLAAHRVSHRELLKKIAPMEIGAIFDRLTGVTTPCSSIDLWTGKVVAQLILYQHPALSIAFGVLV